MNKLFLEFIIMGNWNEFDFYFTLLTPSPHFLRFSNFRFSPYAFSLFFSCAQIPLFCFEKEEQVEKNWN